MTGIKKIDQIIRNIKQNKEQQYTQLKKKNRERNKNNITQVKQIFKNPI